MLSTNYILITGGLGFIGSHVIVKLLSQPCNIVILDNLINSNITVLDMIKEIIKTNHNVEFIKGDIRDKNILIDIFTKYKIKTVFHFAALKSVSESQKFPDLYHEVNIEGTKNLINVMAMYECKEFIYSSSATVYGNSLSPVTEETVTGNGLSCNYARNKYDIENYLIDNSKDNMPLCNWKIIILRYFNPVGAHPSGLIGENPNGIPNNIFPYLLRVAKSINSNDLIQDSPYNIFTIFGNDYLTKDGTCIRDYVHVQDLARAHVDVLKLFDNELASFVKIYNVGTGKGTTVKELIDTFNYVLIKRNKKPIIYQYGSRREGDLDVSYSEVNKIFEEVGFKTIYDIETICVDGLNFINL